jgi:two-component sensor histidine kinase
MMNRELYLILFLSYLVCGSDLIIGQNRLVDESREQAYQRVFVDTDNFGESYLDSLEYYYLKVQSPTLKYQILNDLAYYTHTRSLDRALELADQGLGLARTDGNSLWEGRFMITRGAILLRMEKLDSAQFDLERARAMVGVEDQIHLNTQLGYVFEKRGQLDKATSYAILALNQSEELDDLHGMAVAYSDLSHLLWKRGQFDKGLEYGLKSLELFDERGLHDMDKDFALYVVGNHYLSLGNHEEALKHFEICIAIGERYGFYNNLSDAYISMAELYTGIGKYKEAEESGHAAVMYAILIGNDMLKMRSWLVLGNIQLMQGRFKKAVENLNKSIEVASPGFQDEFYLMHAYDKIARAYARTFQYKEAHEAVRKYDSLKSNVFSAERQQRMSELETQFEVAQKENTIQDQQLRLQKQKSSQTMITIFAALLLLLLVLLYITYENNRTKNNLLERQNKEKEFLLKEIHHRVKNNLGIVSSLLDLQSAEMKDPKVVQAINESQNRVYSMSMIHQKLYLGENLSAIEMKDYFQDLCEHILDSFGLKNKVEIHYNMEVLELDVDTAIPLGLIANELITNCLKHAFPENQRGEVYFSFQLDDNGLISLRVEDNGVGQKNGRVNGQSKNGFGTKLIGLLVHQLDGKMTTKTGNGTQVQIDFPSHQD